MIISCLIVILATFAWGAVHSLLASLSVKQLARRMFGSGVDRWYRIIYNLIAIATSLLIFILPLTLPDRLIYIISFPWVLITLFIQVASLILLLIGLYQTGAGTFFGISQLFGKSASLLPGVLITNGLYPLCSPSSLHGRVVVYMAFAHPHSQLDWIFLCHNCLCDHRRAP